MSLVLPFEGPLVRGTFLKRYKRFFVDVALPSGETLTVHCANSGSMRSCLVEGAPAYVLDSKNPERKLRFSLELLEFEDGLACLNTARANALVEQFLLRVLSKNSEFLDTLPTESRQQLEADFSAPGVQSEQERFTLKREAKFTAETRFDFLLEGALIKLWVEVKSVSLRLNASTVAFPDAVTERGQKHLRHLMAAVEQGSLAILLFVCMRGGSREASQLALGFRAAQEIDPAYAELLALAKAKGVKVRMLVPSLTPEGFGVRGYFALS